MRKKNDPNYERRMQFEKITENCGDHLPSVKKQLKTLLNEGINQHDLFTIGAGSYWLGYVLFRSGNRKGVLSYALKATTLFAETEEYDLAARSYNLLAVYYIVTGSYLLAADAFRKLSDILKEHPDASVKTATLNCNIAENYCRMGDQKKAIKYGEKSIKEVLKTTPDDYRLLFTVAGNLSEYYERDGQYDKALESIGIMKDAMEKAENRVDELARYFLRTASVRYSMGDIPEGNIYADISLSGAEAKVSMHEYSKDYERLALDLISRKDFDRAMAFMKLLEDYSKKTGMLSDKISEYKIKHAYYDAIRDHAETLRYAKLLNECYELRSEENLSTQLDIQDKLFAAMDDAKKLIRQAQESEKNLNVDALTGFFNKAGAEKFLVPFCRKGEGTLMVLDLDNFKLINDLYGHARGDDALVLFAKILRSRCRAGDIICRVGGDEFVVCLENKAEERVIANFTENINLQLMEECRKLLGEDFEVPIGVSVGAVYIPETGGNYDVLFRKADKALYRVKRNGRHGYCFYFGENEFSDIDNATGNLSRMMAIFGERGAAKEAFSVGTADFSTIYRYVARHSKARGTDAYIVMFRLQREGGSDDEFATAVYRFGNVLRKTLSNDNAMTFGRSSTFFVLLPDADAAEVQRAADNVAEIWKAAPDSGLTALECSFRSILK